MKKILYFKQPLNPVFELVQNLFAHEGKIETKNNSAKLLTGYLSVEKEKLNTQVKLSSKPGGNLLIFHAESELGEPFFKKIEFEIQNLEKIYETEINLISTESSVEEKETKECPYCAETIKFKAVKCRYCGESLSDRVPTKLNERVGPSITAGNNPEFSESSRSEEKKSRLDIEEKSNRQDKGVTYFGRKFSATAQIIFFFGIMGFFVLFIALMEGNSGEKENEIRYYTADKFKSTIGYSKTLMRYTHGDLKMLINYWGIPDEVFETSESDIGYYKRILRCSWNNVRVDGKQVEINFEVPDYYELIDVSDFTKGNIDMELADAAKVISYQTKRSTTSYDESSLNKGETKTYVSKVSSENLISKDYVMGKLPPTGFVINGNLSGNLRLEKRVEESYGEEGAVFTFPVYNLVNEKNEVLVRCYPEYDYETDTYSNSVIKRVEFLPIYLKLIKELEWASL